MKTEVTMKRSFMGGEVSQKSKSLLFSATDMVKIGNQKRQELNAPPFNLSAFLKNKQTLEFIEELQTISEKVIVRGRGRGAHTWVHPLLFIDIALALNPKFKVEVYKWLYDELIRYRNDSGASYKKMAGSLYVRTNGKADFHKTISSVARQIKIACNVNDWESASEKQLQARDRIHENISLLCSVMTNTDEAVRIGIIKGLETNF